MSYHFKAVGFICRLFALALLAGQVFAAENSRQFAPEVRRVIFLGDSITYGGYYVSDIVAYQRSREPKRQIEFINLGLSSENTSGLSEPGHAGGKFPRPDLHERLARVLEKTKPDLVIACYGMNDGIFLPFDAARFQAFTNGMTWFHETVEKSGAKIIHVTPPIFDEVKGGHAGYAAVLDKFSEWLMTQRTNGWQVVDLHTPMKQALADKRAKNPAFAFAKDGIHPDEQGHWLMAKTILTALGAKDLDGITNASGMFSDRTDGKELLRLIHQQSSVMKDAWLTDIGHKRPQKAGLPLPEAQKQAAEIETQIQKLLPPSIHAAKWQPDQSAAMRLHLPGAIESSLDAIPLGNGLCGGLLWGSGTNVFLSLDRGDLWDLRPHPSYTNADFTYQTMVEMAQAKRTAELNRQFAKVSVFPTKVPGARLVVELPAGVSVDGFSLDLRLALGTAELKGASAIDCFFSGTVPVAMLKIPGARPAFKLVGNPCFKKELGFADAEVENTADSSSLLQKVGGNFSFAIHVQAQRVKDETVLAICIVTSRDDKNPLALARKRTAAAIAKGYETLQREHEAWWSKFWAKSSVQIPAPAIQLHYNLVQYYYGAASRTGSPPIPLQGIWSTDNGKLPPWRGDYHHDLNTELTYWAYLNSGRFDQGLSFIEFMWSLKPVHEEFARKFVGVPAGHIVPGVMALDGKPMGSWLQYTLSPTMGAWVAQSFHLHWRYTMDKDFLTDRAYPYCAGIGEALLGVMKPDVTTGKLKLPLSTSPEMHDNTQAAWLTPNSNNDLALLRWLFAANEEMAGALGRDDDAKKWKSALLNLDELAVEGDAGALRLSPDESQIISHRHLAHLMAIYPLGILNRDGTDRDSAVIDASLQQLEQLGDKSYCGYSHAWRACMMARAGRPEQALESLLKYLPDTRRSGFHCNTPNSSAVTLEGNFAAGQAVHEMLLQSWGAKLRIFPAVPVQWREAAFERLRAEGGFIVSARRVAGKTTSVSITATVDQSLQLVNPFGEVAFRADREVTRAGNLIRCDLKANQTLKLQLRK